ncbi:MAG: hypothetical protein ABIY51_06040 [Ferruginibacter sp.]
MHCFNRFNPSLFLFCCLFILHSCAGSKASSQKTPWKELPSEQLNLNPAKGLVGNIVFLTIEIRLADSLHDQYAFRLTDVKYAAGTLKKQFYPDETSYEQTIIYCEILDEGKNRIDLIKVQNPLMKVYEYSDEKTNMLGKKLMISNSGSFMLRFNYTERSKYIMLYKTGKTLNQLKRIYYATL